MLLITIKRGKMAFQFYITVIYFFLKKISESLVIGLTVVLNDFFSFTKT